MKNIRAYLTIAVVSLMLVVVSAFSMSTVGHQAAVCVRCCSVSSFAGAPSKQCWPSWKNQRSKRLRSVSPF